MTQPIGTLQAPTAACEDTLSDGGNKFNIHLTCSTQDDHCFSADTELLTKDGWVPYQQIIAEDTLAATFNLQTGAAEYEVVTSLHVYDHFKELIRFRARGTEILVTPEHRMVYRPRNRKSEWRVTTAEDLSRLSKWHPLLPVAGIGHDIPFNRSDDYLRLLAWIVAEGSIANRTKKYGHGYQIGQNAGPQADRIEGLLNRNAIPFWKSGFQRKNWYSLFIIPGSYCRTTFCADLTQKVPDIAISSLSQHQFRILLGELILGDGFIWGKGYRAKDKITAVDTWVKTGTMPCIMTYASKNQRLIDWLQALCAFNGIRTCATRRPSGATHLYLHDSAILGNLTADRVPYDGNVWCVSVMKNQTLFLRRKGRVFVAGNTQYLKTCSVRRLEISTVRLSTGEAPSSAFFGNYPTLAFSTQAAQKVQWSVEVPPDMNVERASYLFAIVGGCSASTENVRSVLEYLNTCHAGGNPEAAAASTSNNLTASTTTGRLSEQLVGTFTSGLFAQNSVLSFAWTRNSSSTVAGDAHPGAIHVVSFQLEYYDRRASTST